MALTKLKTVQKDLVVVAATHQAKAAKLKTELTGTAADIVTTKRELARIEALDQVSEKDMLKRENAKRRLRTLQQRSTQLAADIESAKKAAADAQRKVTEDYVAELGRRILAARRGLLERAAELEAELGESLADFGQLLVEEAGQVKALRGLETWPIRDNPFQGRSALERVSYALAAQRENERHTYVPAQAVARKRAEWEVEPDDSKGVIERKAVLKKRAENAVSSKFSLESQRLLEKIEREDLEEELAE